MHILLVEPFFSGSHRQWAEGYQRHSSHRVDILSLPGRHWKWRMYGAAVTLAHQSATRYATAPLPDLLLCTDMLDVATFRALLPPAWRTIPTVIYFHENQLTYPWSPTDPDVELGRDRHYGWLNYTSALAADGVYFNSDHHRRAFLTALPEFLRAFPDQQPLFSVDIIAQRSEVLPLGLDLPDDLPPRSYPTDRPRTLLWNHRWEYDKNPTAFFDLCTALAAQGLDFRLIVLGQSFGRSPVVFTQAREHWRDRTLHWGYVTSRTEYWQWLRRADLLPVTSHHDFFGISTVEAIHAGVYPLLPNRLAYPEHIPAHLQALHLYEQPTDLVARVAALLQHGAVPAYDPARLESWSQRYRWQHLANHYDTVLAAAATR